MSKPNSEKLQNEKSVLGEIKSIFDQLKRLSVEDIVPDLREYLQVSVVINKFDYTYFPGGLNRLAKVFLTKSIYISALSTQHFFSSYFLFETT